jgi:hypothetical protein
MEEKINIAEILKDKPKGTKLYADAFGELSIEEICTEDDNGITLSDNGGTDWLFYNDGKYSWRGESILVPSKEMRDWRKFAWKKGDVLISNDYGTEVIFYDWYDDTYTNFYGKHRLDSENKNNIKYNDVFLCTTGRYSLEDKDAAQTYINTIEERLGGKLNRETLEVEKTQPEFKDGDIVALVVRKCTHIAIFQSRQEAYIGFHAVLCQNDELLLEEPFREDVGDIELRLATDSEKQQLFDALEKEGKAWDAEKKQIVDLKPKWTPKPFDKVITRVDGNAIWTANIFSHVDKYGEYVTIGCVGGYSYCIPYNEETAKLIGTTDDWEGGEK